MEEGKKLAFYKDQAERDKKNQERRLTALSQCVEALQKDNRKLRASLPDNMMFAEGSYEEDSTTRLVGDVNDSFLLVEEFDKLVVEDDQEAKRKTEVISIQNRESNRLVETALMENWMEQDNQYL
jgi:hypothetical protein